MSIRVMSRVWDISKAEGAKLLILLALADRADEEGICWPSVAYLALKARISERQAQRLLRELEDEEAIRVEKRAGRGKTNRYRVVCGVEKVKQAPPNRVFKGAIQSREKVPFGTEKVKSYAEKVKPTPPDLSINHSPIKELPRDILLLPRKRQKYR